MSGPGRLGGGMRSSCSLPPRHLVAPRAFFIAPSVLKRGLPPAGLRVCRAAGQACAGWLAVAARVQKRAQPQR